MHARHGGVAKGDVQDEYGSGGATLAKAESWHGVGQGPRGWLNMLGNMIFHLWQCVSMQLVFEVFS